MNCPFSVWSGGTGLVQRCLSDPGSEGCAGSMTSAICHIGENFIRAGFTSQLLLHLLHSVLLQRCCLIVASFLNVYFYER